jgi:hypothetical protein
VAVYFVETSALAKRDIAERGSTWLRAVLDPGTGCSIYIVRVTAIEMIAAITRRERGGDPCANRCRHDPTSIPS